MGKIKFLIALLAVPALFGFAANLWAAEGVSNEMFAVNNTWMLVATFLVFIMHLGFATLESGLTRSKNTVNILFKNTLIVSIGLLTYALCGFNLMYPGDFSIGSYFGFAGWGVSTDAAGLTSAYNEGYTYWTDFIFQAMFAQPGTIGFIDNISSGGNSEFRDQKIIREAATANYWWGYSQPLI